MTNYPFIDNFFTWTEDIDKIGITLWQTEEIYLHAEKDVYDYILFSISTELTWLELKRNAIKTKPNIHFSNLFHRETRGCPFDLCAYKLDKIKKLSNPVLCSKCRRKLDEWKVSTELLSNVIEYLKEYKLSDIYTVVQRFHVCSRWQIEEEKLLGEWTVAAEIYPGTRFSV